MARALRSPAPCGARLEPQKQSCPGCQAILVGVVSSDDERLAAEEAAAKEAVAYDYFTDEQVSADEKDEARLLTAIYAEWVMTRDLVSAGFRENHPELLERAARGELGTSELFAIYSTEEGLVNETCASFNDAYFEEQGAWNADDYRLLTTANRIRDTRAGYRRVQALLDRRFEEWKLGRT